MSTQINTQIHFHDTPYPNFLHHVEQGATQKTPTNPEKLKEECFENVEDLDNETLQLVDPILLDPRPFNDQALDYIEKMKSMIKEIRLLCYRKNLDELLGLTESSCRWVFIATSVQTVYYLIHTYSIEAIVMTPSLLRQTLFELKCIQDRYSVCRRPNKDKMKARTISQYAEKRNEFIIHFLKLHNLIYALSTNPTIYL